MALFGDLVIPFEYAGVLSGSVTRGLRPYDSPEITIPSADQYFDKIREAGILLDKEERKASIVEQVSQAASLVGGEAIIEEGLLNEVTNLVEMPTAVMGGFDKELSVPAAGCIDLGDEETSALFPGPEKREAAGLFHCRP